MIRRGVARIEDPGLREALDRLDADPARRLHGTDALQAWMQETSDAAIEALLRQQYSLRQVLAGIADTGFVPQASNRAALDAVFQRREVQIARIDAQPFAAQVQPTDAQLRALELGVGALVVTNGSTVERHVLDIADLPHTLVDAFDISCRRAGRKTRYDNRANCIWISVR